MGSAISSSQGEAQTAFEKYQRRKHSYRVEQKAEEEQESQKAAAILQEFKDRPWPEALPRACEVLPDVFIGSLYDAMDAAWVERTGITHAVSGTLAQNPFAGKVQRFVAIVDDEEPGDVWRWFERTCTFINDALQEGGRVLVHCEWGVSRSPTLAAAYLMRSQGCTAAAALEHLKGVRDCVRPNRQFQGALKEWQGTLHIEEPLSEEAKLEEQSVPQEPAEAAEPPAQEDSVEAPQERKGVAELALAATASQSTEHLICTPATTPSGEAQQRKPTAMRPSYCELPSKDEVAEEETSEPTPSTSELPSKHEVAEEAPGQEETSEPTPSTCELPSKDEVAEEAPVQEDTSEPTPSTCELPSKDEVAEEGEERSQQAPKETLEGEGLQVAKETMLEKEPVDEINVTNDPKDDTISNEKARSIKGRRKRNNKASKKQGLQQTSEAHQRYEC